MPDSTPDPLISPWTSAVARVCRPVAAKIKTALLNREVATYLIFGVLTTALNYAVYFGLRLFISWPAANVVAWLVAVEFAFVTNRAIVFRSRGPYFPEMAQFYLSRLATLGLESLTIWIVLDLLQAPEWFAKLFANVLVVVGNYILSKALVFRRKRRAGAAASALPMEAPPQEVPPQEAPPMEGMD